MLSLGEIVSLVVVLGTLTTIGTQVFDRLSRRSLRHRKEERLKQANELLQFFQLSATLEGVAPNPSLASSVVHRAKGELDRVLVDLNQILDTPANPPAVRGEMSFLRRWFLLYAPQGWRTWVAHCLFYSITLVFVLFTYSIGYDDTRDEFLWNTFAKDITTFPSSFGVFAFGFVVLWLRYWGTVEDSWSAGGQTTPLGRLAVLFLWHKPVNRGELLGRLLLIGTVGRFLIGPLVPPEMDSVIMRWHIINPLFPACVSVFLGYYWSQAELRAFLAARPKLAFPHNLRFLYRSSGLEAWLAQIAFYSFACLAIAEVLYVRPCLSSIEGIRACIPQNLLSLNGSADEVFFLRLGWFAAASMTLFLPVYGSYRWGLAGFQGQEARPL